MEEPVSTILAPGKTISAATVVLKAAVMASAGWLYPAICCMTAKESHAEADVTAP